MSEKNIFDIQQDIAWRIKQDQLQGSLLCLNQSIFNKHETYSSTDVIAALYGFNFKIQCLKLNITANDQTQVKRLLWVEASQCMRVDELDKALNKIIQYFGLTQFCSIHIDDEQAEVCIQHQHCTYLSVDEIDAYLETHFYNLCSHEDFACTAKTYQIQIDAECTKALHPQTNNGKLARELKVKDMLKKIQ